MGIKRLISVSKSVNKSFPASPAEKPTAEEIALLIGERNAPPKVHAYEIAERLGIDSSSLSLFENGRRALPRGLVVRHYRAALADLKRAKRAGVAA